VTTETAPTPELTQATLPGVPDVEAHVNSAEDPAPSTASDVVALDTEGDAEPDADTEAEPEPKGERTIDDIEADWNARKELSRDEIDRLIEVHSERQQAEAERVRVAEQQAQFAEQQKQLVPNYFTQMIQRIQHRSGMSDQELELLRYELANDTNDVMGKLQLSYTAPISYEMSRELQAIKVAGGMTPQKASEAANPGNFKTWGEMIQDAYKEGQKKASLSKDDVTYDWFKKNRPDEYKKFHKDFPERGGGIKPADSGGAGGAKYYSQMTNEERAAMSPAERNAAVAREYQARFR
jgi:hypothetical protein